MTRRIGTLALALALLAGSLKADESELKKAQADILALAKKIADGKDVSREAAVIRKKHDELNAVMHAFKPSNKGGIGTGEAISTDGIEGKIIALTKRTLPAATLEKEKQQLVRAAQISEAIAEITRHYVHYRRSRRFAAYADEMKTAAKELRKAIEGGKPAEVKAAATRLNTVCTDCHS